MRMRYIELMKVYAVRMRRESGREGGRCGRRSDVRDNTMGLPYTHTHTHGEVRVASATLCNLRSISSLVTNGYITYRYILREHTTQHQHGYYNIIPQQASTR